VWLAGRRQSKTKTPLSKMQKNQRTCLKAVKRFTQIFMGKLRLDTNNIKFIVGHDYNQNVLSIQTTNFEKLQAFCADSFVLYSI